MSRGRAQVVRLALICAVLDGSRVVNENHLRAGLAVWRYCESSAARIFRTPSPSPSVNSRSGGGSSDRLVVRLLNTITASPGVHRRDLRRTSRPDTDADFDEGLAFLETHGMAFKRTVMTAGRPAEAWFPGKPPVGDDDHETGNLEESFTMGTDDPSPVIVNASATLTTTCHMSYVGSVVSPPCDLRHMTYDTSETYSDMELEKLDIPSDVTTYFVDACRALGLTIEQAKNPHALTNRQLRDRKWCYECAVAKAKHAEWQRSIWEGQSVSDEEYQVWMREMMALCGDE